MFYGVNIADVLLGYETCLMYKVKDDSVEKKAVLMMESKTQNTQSSTQVMGLTREAKCT